jgi:hypothetical protein
MAPDHDRFAQIPGECGFLPPGQFGVLEVSGRLPIQDRGAQTCSGRLTAGYAARTRFPRSWVGPHLPLHACSGNIWVKDSLTYFLAAETLSHTLPPSKSLPQCRAITLPVVNSVARE